MFKKKKGVYPFNKGPTPGPSQEFSHYLPTASSARQSREGVGQILGVLWGGVLAPLSRSCLAVSARAQASEPCWRRWTTWRQVSLAGPAGEGWGCWGHPEALAGQKKGQGREPGERCLPDTGQKMLVIDSP